MEMNVGMLKDLIMNLSDDAQVFVACQGYCNFNFNKNKPFKGTDTFAVMHDGKLFITDEYAVKIDEDGNTL